MLVWKWEEVQEMPLIRLTVDKETDALYRPLDESSIFKSRVTCPQILNCSPYWSHVHRDRLSR